MRMPRKRLFGALGAVLLALAAGRAAGHGDEDHGQDARPAASPVLATATDVALAASASPQRLPDGSLFVPKPVQHQWGLRTQMARVEDLAATVELNGKVIADPNAGGRVQSIQSGRIEPGPRGLPTLGQRVTKGEVLAYLQPASNSIDRGNQQAQLAELESKLAIAERDLRRQEQLADAVPKKEVEAARFELEALKKRRAAVGASLSAPEPLLAPVAGVVGAANVVAGQVVETKEVLFEVVDPGRLAVEALAYDATLVEGIASASAPVPGGALELRFVGGGRQLREQAIPLLFRVASASAPVAVGQPLKVIAKTARTARGAAVPQGALVRNGAGEWVAWVHTAAERFVPRPVRFATLDAASAMVTSGLADGERVVTQGAGLLGQVR
ncbi:MAG: efflux RND transporter periplasmic adaptor subunit [Chromatiaceae bacterium]|nr:efflux RND transporter periplasmic adaptor subunit [Chromatiaceae bacterium]